ncbi:ABC transporter ATP-binding protein [Halosimplex rubrum]|uniref:Molybdate/tungstate import ATP-binding protein WtpC n=1 Tax=Halosimplex rubrum TaxID=869889 RepID=A0A7D5NYW1_9EURY|nr:ABC transporter ATP-binding protein [Halosimplex rubrum]QLH76766.1 ABC transporter ATP-binding protein [Halosimplex rubrum]
MSRDIHRNPAATPATSTAPDATDGPVGEPVLELDGVVRSYASETAVEELSLTVGDGEVLTLLGPSGCGKTTTLRLVGGLEHPDAGSIELRETPIADADNGTVVPPEERGIGLVFQDFALFPHMTAAENVGFGLDDWDEADRRERVADLLELVDLADHGEDYPGELSGGQKQRVALARSLAPEPDVLLLDEPLSNLDVSLRVSMREEIRRIIDETGVTAIWVTHDQEEALSVADRVGIMNDGRLRQVGRPERIFERPASRFVASFLGRTGFLSGERQADTVATDLGRIDADRIADLDAVQGETVDVLVRPDDLRATPTTEGEAHGRITSRQYQGPSFVYRVETAGGDTVHCLQNHTEVFDVGQPVAVDLVADHPLQWFPRD